MTGSTVAVVLDVDGVLLRGGHEIPGASEALHRLRAHNVPVCFATNACGTSEEERAVHLSHALHCNTVTGDHMVLSHTPAKSLVARLGASKILATGTAHMVDVVRQYGFTNVVWATDYVTAMPSINPLRARGVGGLHSKEDLHAQDGKTTQHGAYKDDGRPFDAVFIFQEPTDYHEDLQVIIDIVRFHGRPPTTREEWLDWCRREKAGEIDPTQRVEVFFANPDLDYQALHPVPRMTMGSFMLCLDTLFKAHTGRTLVAVPFGKPVAATYEYVQRVLTQLCPPGRKIERIFAVGDNPKSDIRGCNSMGKGWEGILVRTGVFQGEHNDPDDPATHVVDHITNAVDIILNALASLQS
eukprot:comp15634_c0_seq1/m.24048 comp15634_c0_seq1/g.24048  ORF comp15634_c0_seq1/g.24048 comp15634_c0_seq1/m.24048 type:complete len:355 (+) comp15634_c0_seq1:54-1118(+)